MTSKSGSRGVLYIVPTPIGNLEDITYRAVRILKSVNVIGAEDTRNSAVLLSNYDIRTPMVSYHKFNEKSRSNYLINLLKEGKDVALISDAGTPGISDPASVLINAAVKLDMNICTLPGATSFIPALVSSGFDTGSFVFIGFLPKKRSLKEELLQRICTYQETLIFFETGQRLFGFLDFIEKYLGNRYICIGREISKYYETYYRNSIDYYLENKGEINLKGEFTIICNGFIADEISEVEIKKSLQRYLDQNESISVAVNKTCSDLKVPKNRTYKIALSLKAKKM